MVLISTPHDEIQDILIRTLKVNIQDLGQTRNQKDVHRIAGCPKRMTLTTLHPKIDEAQKFTIPIIIRVPRVVTQEQTS